METRDIAIMSGFLSKALGVDRWDKDHIKVPFMSLPVGFEFSPIFPFAGAAARFLVRKIGGGREISVYLDTKEQLGFFGAPYWEAYSIDNNNERYALDDVDGLIAAIVKELNKPTRDLANE